MPCDTCIIYSEAMDIVTAVLNSLRSRTNDATCQDCPLFTPSASVSLCNVFVKTEYVIYWIVYVI